MAGDGDNPTVIRLPIDPRTDCVMPASRPDSPAFTDVHFYHPATVEATYRGTILILRFDSTS
jgi:hypothetical protein